MPSSNYSGFEPGVNPQTRRALLDLRKQVAELSGRVDAVDGTTPPTWTTVALINGWTHMANEPVRYRKIGDVVEWQGRCNFAAPGSTTNPFSAPVGFRPMIDMPVAASVVVPAGPAWTTGTVYFTKPGPVGLLTAALVGITFNGISYSTTS